MTEKIDLGLHDQIKDILELVSKPENVAGLMGGPSR